MTRVSWDAVGEHRFETGVDHGVLYIPTNGVYDMGYAWNGLTAVTESPSGAEPTPLYADNIKYLNLLSVEEFAATIEAFTYPDEFAACDGTAVPEVGVYIGQQTRQPFGLSYRTKIGNDLNPDAGYKLHLVYGCLAAPSEKGYTTVNENPEAVTFSWEVSTTPVEVPGYKNSATITIDSTKVDSVALGLLEDALYGTPGQDPRLPTPEEVIAFFSGTMTLATPTEPAFDSGTDTITIPAVTGVIYKIDGEAVAAGPVVITVDTVVKAVPAVGYYFPSVVDTDWFYDYTP